MVEAPRIRVFYENICIFKNKKIVGAQGTTYKKLDIDLIGGIIEDIWFYGKHLFLSIRNIKLFLIKVHFMMYGRVVVNGTHPKPNIKTPNFKLILENNDELSWYFSQIKVVDESYLSVSKKMIYFDISHSQFDKKKLYNHIKKNINRYLKITIVDLLLDQDLFPGVGNILQQEALYMCKVAPTRLVHKLATNEIKCLIDNLHQLAMRLYNLDIANTPYYERHSILIIYHKAYCILGHKTTTKYLGNRQRRTTWCPTCTPT